MSRLVRDHRIEMPFFLGIEILDESDRVVDMRRLAAEIRDRRLARHRVAPSATSGAGH